MKYMVHIHRFGAKDRFRSLPGAPRQRIESRFRVVLIVPISPVGTIVEMHRFEPPNCDRGGKETNDVTFDKTGKVTMKPILAIVKLLRFDSLRDAFISLDVQVLADFEIKGFEREKGQTEIYRGIRYKVGFLPNAKSEVVVFGQQADGAIEPIVKAPHTCRIDDMEQTMRISIGEIGVAAH